MEEPEDPGTYYKTASSRHAGNCIDDTSICCLKKTCIRTALVDMLTQTEETSQSSSLDEELLAITGCGERENQFSPGTSLQ